jgi:hypothetical protein
VLIFDLDITTMKLSMMQSLAEKALLVGRLPRTTKCR